MNRLYFKYLIPFVLHSFITVSAFSQLEFVKHSISSPNTPADVSTADINGDGNMDILTVSAENGGSVIWWKNNGSQGFTRNVIASGFNNPRSVRAGDIDLDGDIDVIAVAWEGDKISWWENDGTEGFSEHIVISGWVGPHTVELCDLDEDGDIDILCSQFDMSATNSEIAWWENDGTQQWTKHVVSNRFQQSPFVYGSDMDNDGDTDLIACGELNGEVCWWENDGEENWTEHVIDNQFAKAHTILARDFDKDGDKDILAHACSSGLQAWYENNGDGTFKKIPMENLGGAIWMECGDFDLDGDNDIVATGMSAASLVCYVNDGKQALTRQDLPGGLISGFALSVVDLDSDNDLDVVAIGRSSNSLVWWENTQHRTSFFDAPKWLNYDDNEGLMFVANEEDGSIVRLEASGYQYCIRNSFPICTGLTYSKGYLWVAIGITIYKLNPISGITELSFRTPGQFLQGLTSDGNGILYSSDPYSGTIFQTDPYTGQTISLATGLDFPQSMKYDPGMDKLIVLDGEYSTSIKCIDPASGQITTAIETTILPGGDIIPDGLGNHYISSPEENSIYAVTSNLSDPVYLYSEGHTAATGMVYFPEDEALGFLSPVLNSLEIIPANATGIKLSGIKNNPDVKFYPNPFDENFSIILPQPIGAKTLLTIKSLSGQTLLIKNIDVGTAGISVDLRSPGITSGVYVVSLQGEGIDIAKMLVKK